MIWNFQAVYADKEDQKKGKGIFDRLEQTKVNTIEKRICVTGLNKSPSIFARLGGKSDTDDTEIDEDTSIRFAGTMKSAPKKVNKTYPNTQI